MRTSGEFVLKICMFLLGQDVLRDKQQQIDQLLRERDLERAQITKAAGQADEAEQKLFQLQQEYENYRSECDLKLRQQIELLAQLRTNETDILSQLDDEKRKNEDLLFRFEEAAITKGDIEVSNETNIKRIKELERQLDEERKKAENLELLSNKLFETEENLFKTREELEEIRNGQQHSSSKELIDNLEKQLETIVNQNVEQEEKLKKINGEFQQILNERNSLQIELDGINKNNKEEIDELKLQLNEKLAIINKYEDDKMAILKENDRLVVELNRKTNDLDSANNQLSIKAEELVIVKDELKRKIDEIDHYVDKCRTNDEELIRKDDQLKENEFKIGKYLEEITKLTNELDEIRLKHSEITNEIEIRHKRQTDDIELKFDNLHKELQMKINETNSLTIVISKLEDDLCKKNGIIEKLNLELESMKRQLIVSDENFQGVFNQLQEIKLEKSQLELDFNQLKHDQHELLVEKTKLQQQLQIEYEKCQDSAQLDELRRQLDEHDKNSMVIRQEFVEKLQNSDRQRQQIELELNQRVQQYERIQMELEEKLNVALKSEQLLKEHCENALIERRTLTDENLAKLQQFEQQLLVKEQELNRIVGKSSEQERLLEALNQQKQNNNEQIRNLNEEIVKLKDELVKKSEDLIGIESKLNLILAENQQNLLNEQQQFNQKIQQLELIQEEKETKLKEIQNEMDLLKMDCQNKNVDVVEKDHKISELFVELQSRQNLINQLQQQLNNHEMINDETMKKYEQHQQYCDDLQQQLVILNEKLQINQELIVNLQLERKNLIDLLKKLRISDLDKKNLLQEIENSDGNQQCSYILELLKNLQVDNFDEIQMKIIELEELLDLTRKQLNDRNEECELKKVEVLRLQQELAREMNGTTTTTTTGQIEDQNTVSLQHEQHEHYNTIQNKFNTIVNPKLLDFIRNMLLNILQKYEILRNENLNLMNQSTNFRINRKLLTILNRLRYDLLQFWFVVDRERYELKTNFDQIANNLKNKERESSRCLLRNNYLNRILMNLPTKCRKFTINQRHTFDNLTGICRNYIIETVRNREIVNLRNFEIRMLKFELANLLKHFEINQNFHQAESRVFVKQVPIFVPQTPRLIIKQIPVLLGTDRPNIVLRYVPIMVRQEPKVLIQQVPIGNCTKNFMSGEYSNHYQSNGEFVEISTIKPEIIGTTDRYLPRIIVKHVPILVPLIKRVPKIIQVPPIYIKQSSGHLHQFYPQFTNNRIKQVPIGVSKLCPKRIFYVRPVPKVLIKQIPVYIQICSQQQQSRNYQNKSKIRIKSLPRVIIEKVPPKIVIKHVPIVQTLPVIVPKIIVRKIRVPPKILIKPIPVVVPSDCSRKPVVLIKQIPVPVIGLNQSCRLDKIRIIRLPPIVITVPKREIVKVPVYIPQQLQSTPLTTTIESVDMKSKLLNSRNQLLKNQIPLLCRKVVPPPPPQIRVIQSPPKILVKPIPIPVVESNDVSTKPIFIPQFPGNFGQLLPGKMKIVNQKVPIPLYIREYVAVPIYIPQKPRILIKNLPILVPISTNISTKSPIILIKQIPIYIPRILVKQVPVPVPTNIASKPFVLIKQIPIVKYLPGPRRILREKVPVKVPIYIDRPKIINREIPISVPIYIPKTRVVIKQIPKIIQIPIRTPIEPSILIKQVPIRVPQNYTKYIKVPVVINRKVPVYVKVPQIVYKFQPGKMKIIKVPTQVPIYIPQTTKVLVKQIPIPVPISNNIPIKPKILIKQVPVYVPQPPKVLTKRILVPVGKSNPIIIKVPCKVSNKPLIIARQIPVLVKIPVCQKSSSRVPKIKQVPVPILVPNSCQTTQKVPIKIPIYLPRTPRILIKQVPVLIPVPKGGGIKPIIIIRQVPISIPTPRICPKQLKTIYVQQPPRLLIKQIPIFVGKNCPRILIKHVAVPVVLQSPYLQRGYGENPVVESNLPWHEIWKIIETIRSQIRTTNSFQSGTIRLPNVLISKLLAFIQQLHSNFMNVTLKLSQSRRAICLLRHFNWRLMEFGNKLLRETNQFIRPLPLPMVHLMRRQSMVPNLVVPSTNRNLLNNLNIAESLYEILQQTQNTLKQCMDAALIQTISLDKCRYQLIQDKEMADNQIKFLNSIIADIQMKNEQQRARIELLESASNLTMEHTNILQKRQVAPRMYCDICEEFDLHETEDCPQQNSDMAANFGGEPRVPRQSNERPYCEICEAFGHSTQECPDDGTY